MRIDHVTMAGPRLEALQGAFAGLGLATDYGGMHANGLTHMALLGFDDGSYIELISTPEPGRHAPRWDAQIAGGGGPCAWAAGVDAIAEEAARLAALGVTVEGPLYQTRRRPDGVLVEWDLLYLGGGEPGAVLPFQIHDRTPREWRVRPSASVAGGELRGVADVVLGVRDLDGAAALFHRVYGWAAPEPGVAPALGARLAAFVGTQVTLATPDGAGSWLGERLERFGESPCAFLIGSADPRASAARLALGAPEAWPGGEVHWIDPARVEGARLGVVAERIHKEDTEATEVHRG